MLPGFQASLSITAESAIARFLNASRENTKLILVSILPRLHVWENPSKSLLSILRITCSWASPFKFMVLRYFNAAGATARHGDDHEPESHLVTNILAACAERKSEVSVFGRDYPAPDGTAIRDYIHGSDLADAHIGSPKLSSKRRQFRIHNPRYRSWSLDSGGDRVRPASNRTGLQSPV